MCIVLLLNYYQPQESPSNVADSSIVVDDVSDFLTSDGSSDPAYITAESVPTEPLVTNVFLPSLIFISDLYID